MESNYSLIQYQTSFIIDNVPPKVAASRLKQLLWSWITSKETYLDFKTRVFDFEYNSLRYEPFHKSLPSTTTKGWPIFRDGKFRPVTVWGQGEGCRIHTSLCFLDDHVYWALRYFEGDQNGDMLTDIGINQGPDKTVFAIKTALRPKNARDSFQPIVPSIINNIWRDESHFEIYSEGSPYSYFDSPQWIETEEDAKKVVDFISSPIRRCAIVIAILNPTSPDIGMGAYSSFASRILGKALVLKVMGGSAAHQALSSVRSTAGIWKLNVGGFYLIHPGDVARAKCPFEEYSLVGLEDEILFERILAHMYRQHPVREDGVVYFDDVERKLASAIAESQFNADEEYRIALNEVKEKEALAKNAVGTLDEAKLQEAADEARARSLRAEEESLRLHNEADEERITRERHKVEMTSYLEGFDDDLQTYRDRVEEQTKIIEAQKFQIEKLKKACEDFELQLKEGLKNGK